MLAHNVLFKHRHPDKTPDFHAAMIRDFHDKSKPRVLNLVFRGGAKSTLSEEAICLMAGFREFKNCLIVGSSYDRAAARLHAIRNELELNEQLRLVFGEMVGALWAEDRITTPAGIMIQAMGRGMSLRGIKHLDQRPDLVLLDDILERPDVTTPENRKKASDWVDMDLLPAIDPRGILRANATPLHPEDVNMSFKKPDADGVFQWEVHEYPIYHLDIETGEPTATWPERFPLATCLRMERDYAARGNVLAFRQEYMVQAEAPEAKPFKREMFRIEPRVRTYQPTWGMIDPARTVKAETSATTGGAVWSWIGSKLVVWDAWADFLFPDQIVKAAFDMDERYNPIAVGVEADGLNEFLLQPIRQEQVRRGHVIPFKAMKAPRGKIDFIRGLQPFFQAREVEFAKPVPDLEAQLLGFPTGRIDVPNALAYALMMRPGAPMYDEFGQRNVSEEMGYAPGRPLYLCLNATDSMVTGVLAQSIDGSLRIHGDFVREGDVSSALPAVVADAQLHGGNGRPLRLVAGPVHWTQYQNVGLRQAVGRLPRDIQQAVTPERGRGVLRSLTTRERAGMPMLLVSSQARWTLNAFLGGYARAMMKGGVLGDFAEDGAYKTLMEGLESFAGLLDLGVLDEEAAERHYAVASDGRRYVSARATR